jgi:hypothetical protein
MITRRVFVQAGLLMGALAMLPKAALALTRPVEAARDASQGPVRPALRPVVSFHMDQPYVDYSGTAEPFVPPAGARSAQFIAALDEEASATLRL